MNIQFPIYLFAIFLCSVIDQIIGCGLRDGKKYFLVRYRGEQQSQIIDWDTAKLHSLEVMEFFGSRLVWGPIDRIIDPEIVDEFNDHTDDQPSTSGINNQNQTSTSVDPNEIEYAD